jgi:hypothetical protein
MNSRPFNSISFKELRSVSGRLNVTALGSEAFTGAETQILFPKMEDAGAVFVDAGWVLYVAIALPLPPRLGRD